MSNESTLVIDVDFIKYAVASKGETRSILVIDKQSGDEFKFKNRTEFKGRGKEIGGWLAVYNQNRTTPYTVDDFEIQDISVPEPIENVLNSAKVMTRRIIYESPADKAMGFIGKGDSFRVERSTICKYKGDRDGLHRPPYLEDVTEYLVKKFGFKIVEDIEADDACIIAAYNRKDRIVCAVDKDTRGCPVLFYNPNKQDEGVIDGNCFGELQIVKTEKVNEKTGKKTTDTKVVGHGRKFFYWQVLYGDDIDCYWANSARPDFKWGEISAANALLSASNDREALEALVASYKTIYPEPVEIIGWRGEKLLVDWKYALEENFQMARMLRTFDERKNVIKVADVLDRMGIK